MWSETTSIEGGPPHAAERPRVGNFREQNWGFSESAVTRAYVERRTTEGRTLREIRRCLKRYLAREIYRRLNTAARNELATT